MTVRRFVGGAICGLPVPAHAGTFVDTQSGVYQDLGTHYAYRPRLTRCAGCGAYVERPATECPLCGAELAQANDARA